MVFLNTCLRCVPLLILIVVVASYLGQRIPLSMDTQIRATHQQLLQSCPSPKLSNISLPLTALASFPGSGNTWFRHLLQQLTGILTGAVYNDLNLKGKGFPGEGRTDGTVIAIKTHLNMTNKYERAILLVRNPFEAFLSEFTRRASHSHIGRVNLFNFIAWRGAVSRMLNQYRTFYTSWLNHNHILVVWYDKLNSNLREELTRTKVFVEDENIRGNIECALVGSEGNFHRNKTDVPLAFLYHYEDRVRINDLIDEMHGKFRQRLNETCDIMLKWKL